MKQQKKRNFGLALLRWLAAMAVTLGFSILGIILLPEGGHSLVGPCFALLCMCVLGSLLGGVCLQGTMERMKVKETLAYGERQRERMQTDARKEKRKVYGAYGFTLTWMAVILLLTGAVCFLAGSETWPQIPALFLFYGFFSCVIRKRNDIDLSKALKESDFPQLYALAKQAAGEDFRGKIHIFMGPPDGEQSCGLSVMEKGKDVCLLLGPILPNVLNEEELLMTLHHEFAHVKLSHTKEIAKFQNLLTFLGGEEWGTLGWGFGFAMLYPYSNLYLKCNFYFTLSSRKKEMEADATAGKGHSASVMAGAFAKICAFNLFWFEGRPYRCLYVSEEAPKSLTTDLVHSYCEAIATRQGQWRELLEKELPARVASHPTFRQRRESLGNPEYSMELRERSEAYAEEGKRLAELSDRSVREVDPEQYKADRKEAYLEPLEIVTEYEAGDKDLTPDALRPVIRAYDLLGRPEEVEAICDSIIVKSEGTFASVYAKYWKGMNLLHRYDPKGIDYLYEAMEANTNYTEEGLNAIGEACTRMGLEQELEEYRRRFETLMQTAQDHHVEGINGKTKLAPASLPEAELEKIMEKILSAGKGNLQRVYLIQEIVSEDYAPNAFVLDYLPDTTDEEKNRIYDELFRYLDDYPEGRDFALYDYEPGMKKPLARFPEALIYEKAHGEKDSTS